MLSGYSETTSGSSSGSILPPVLSSDKTEGFGSSGTYGSELDGSYVEELMVKCCW